MWEENKEFRDPHIHVSCARLQAQGLIIRMDRKNTTLDLATTRIPLLPLGCNSANGAFKKLARPVPKGPQPCLVWSRPCTWRVPPLGEFAVFGVFSFYWNQ